MRIPARQHAETMVTLNCTTEIDGYWFQARPEPFHCWSERWILAWAVFTGKADALYYHKQ